MTAVATAPGAVSPRRLHLASPTTATAIAIATLLLIGAGIPLTLAAHQNPLDALSLLPLMGPFAVVGLVIARRQPANPIGWLMLALAPIYTISADTGLYSVIAFRHGHPDLPLARLAVALTGCWIVLPLLLPLPILLFPDGRVPTGRWRWTFWAYLVLDATLVIGSGISDTAAFTAHHVRVDHAGELAGSTTGAPASIGVVLFVAATAIGLSWVARQVLAYRRSTGARRQQLKWLMSGGAVGVTGFVLALVFNGSSNAYLRALSVGFVGVIAVPVSIGIGILKYRLYEIDRLISRTLSYTVVTGLLVGVYVGLVTLTTRTLPLSSPVGVAASTLAAAALFHPLRKSVQRIVDRRFNRARYDADATVALFTAGLRDAVDLDRVQRDLLETVHRSVQPAQVSVWLTPQRPA
jgi:hypothetical protein